MDLSAKAFVSFFGVAHVFFDAFAGGLVLYRHVPGLAKFDGPFTGAGIFFALALNFTLNLRTFLGLNLGSTRQKQNGQQKQDKSHGSVIVVRL